ncbi:MAG: nucleotidyltransferase family protein [Bacillota bacterium]|nr:nucleotidyltransferase family protein [Bacillota bacterium]
MFRAVVLAAGSSSRMGKQNKLLLPLNDKPVIENVLLTLTMLQQLETVVVTTYPEIITIAEKYNAKVAFPKSVEHSQSNSLKSGLDNIQADIKGIFFILGDQPFISSTLLALMMKAFLYLKDVGTDRDIIVPYYLQTKGNPPLIDVKYVKELRKITGDKGARDILQNHSQNIFKLQVTDPLVFKDIDTNDDYQQVKFFR